tara:strand:+ start:421 stop:810 length:390 start_codon:yes stop_codon:yes gene_type:complete
VSNPAPDNRLNSVGSTNAYADAWELNALRQREQWQDLASRSLPSTWYFTSPQKHSPVIGTSLSLMHRAEHSDATTVAPGGHRPRTDATGYELAMQPPGFTTRCVDAGYLPSSDTGRMGRGEKLPPQLGH